MSLVISHRGANKLAPENTLPAFELSLSLGVDGFENDVHMTRDGVIVVCHDDTVDRTSNGHGAIESLTFDELRALDFGAWFDPKFAGTTIPTLEEFFALCGSLKVVNVEIKRALDGSTPIAAGVIRMAKRFGLFGKLIISSFDLDMLAACTREDADTCTALLYDPRNPLCEEIHDDLGAFAKKHNLKAYHPMIAFLSRDYIEEAHEAGIIVNPWTVNQPHQMQFLRDWGCDGVITDQPELALQIMQEG
ncbi:MAG: glycerophosphodiester phosphodiesterase [Oscillospiraceae bacterium]|jgi:glycerophosphoryl diester phosphodiesterase|nr:glycerophosphodiester phosphodiesterase [Oscillospiraceae bacterium]